MKSYIIKMISIILVIGSIINIIKITTKEEILIENHIENTLAFQSEMSSSRYTEEIVYEGLTLYQLGSKIDNVLSSTLSGYGEKIATIALENEVDPIVASSIILVETGCKWNCSSLVKQCNNVGGMKGKGGCGSYAKFNTLDQGIESFILNLSRNYYQKGLNTPELMNRKYAENPNWHKDVNYYVKTIKAS